MCAKPANNRLILGSWFSPFPLLHSCSILLCNEIPNIPYIHTVLARTYIYIIYIHTYIRIYQHPVLYLPPLEKQKNIYLQGLTPKLPSCFDQQFSLPPSYYFWLAIAAQPYLRQQLQLPSNLQFPLAPPLLPLLHQG